jgi:hypothetical protein
MADIRDLVPFVAAPQWGAWEPVALSMIVSGAMAMVAASLASWQAGNQARTSLFAFVSVCALACGLYGVSVPLEQPWRAWEFYARPAFTSWTAWGAWLAPLCLVCGLVLLWRMRPGRGAPRAMSLSGLASGCLVLAYATGEVRACVGRELWASPWSTLALLAAGATGAAGLAVLLGPCVPGGDGPVSAYRRKLSLACALMAVCCLLPALLVRAPEGFAPLVGPWWHGPEVLMALAGTCALAVGSRRPRAMAARGAAGVLAAVLLTWKIIHMGEIFGRNASLYPARLAFSDLVSAEALAAFTGTAGLMLLLALALPRLMPSPPTT